MNNQHLSLQVVRVGPNEIEEMLDCYDSGMADRTTSNAIVLALKKILKPKIQINLLNNPFHEVCQCWIEGTIYSLSGKLSLWLDRAEHAHTIKPIWFSITLSNTWLLNPLKLETKPSRMIEVLKVA